METLADRMTERMSELGLRDRDVVDILEHVYGVKMSQPAINYIKSGRTKNPKHVVFIAKTLECSVDWLLTGAGNKVDGDSYLKQQQEASSHSVKEPVSLRYGSDMATIYRVPLISTVQAGCWQFAADQYDTGDYYSYVETSTNVSEKGFALTVSGDSMTSDSGVSLPDGMIVIVDPDIEPANGRIVIARLASSNEAVIKKLVIDGPNRYLMSLNSKYSPIAINEDCQIVGVVIKGEIDL